MIAAAREVGMGRDVHGHQQVTGRRAVGPFGSLLAKADSLPLLDTGRNLDGDRLHFAVGPPDGELLFAARHGRLEGDRDLPGQVGAALRLSATAFARTSSGLRKLFEQVLESLAPRPSGRTRA